MDTPRHRALGSPTRVAMLHLVRSSDSGLTAAEVAARTGLHLSTARDHLERLASAGLLVRHRHRQAGRPGRPAWRYHAAEAADPAPAPYRDLAAALLAQLRGRPAAAERAGRDWGRRLAAQAPAATGAEALHRVLDRLGFAPASPTGRAGELHLRACPFLDLVARQPEAMCGLHRGVVRGVLGGSSGEVAADLVPFGATDACVVRLPASASRPVAGGRSGSAVPS